MSEMKTTNATMIRNLSTAFLANLVSLIGSVILTLILPKFLGVSQYAYYQLYIFYAGYIGFLGLGLIEGIYLRYGGDYYETLDTALFSGILRFFSFFEGVVSGILLLAVMMLNIDGHKKVVFLMFCLCIIVYLPRALLHNILQATGRIQEHAIGIIIEKAVHILCTLGCILLKKNFFLWFIASELTGRACAAIYIFYICRNLVGSKPIPVKQQILESIKSLSCGITLLIANVASLLIIGIMRQTIELVWDVETFGKVSLTLSISHLLMIFINSISVVLFPLLRRSSEAELSNKYKILHTSLMVLVLGMLNFYYPARLILSMWLPKYSESLAYMAILFPMCIYESKMSMLVSTYLKTLRKEISLLIVNLITVSLSGMFAFITCRYFHSLDMAIFSIILLLAVRCFLAELILSIRMKHNIIGDIIAENILVVIFITGNWFIGGVAGVCIYLAAFIVYLCLKKRAVRNVFKLFPKHIKGCRG